MFGDIEIEKNKFYYYKSPSFLKDVDIEKVLVSNNIYFDGKKTINTLLVTCIMIIKLNYYIKGYDRQTKWMYILIEDDEKL